MTISKFRELHKLDTVTLPLSAIELTEPCHVKAVKKEAHVSKLNDEPTCIVLKNDSDSYSLIIGYRDYMTAKASGAEQIKAIVVPDKSRRDFLKSLSKTPELWDLSNVHEPSGWTPPRQEKVTACQRNYEATGLFGKAIKVSPSGTILDGYAAVCAARVLGVKKIPVFVSTFRCKNKKNYKKFVKPT